MILDGVMIILSSTCLTVFHPGVGFGKQWAEAGFRFRKGKQSPITGHEHGSPTEGSVKVEPYHRVN